MTKESLLIIGASGHSKVIIDIIEKEGKYNILGLLDSQRPAGDKILGYTVLGKEEELPSIISISPGCKLFIAIGDNWIRNKVVNKMIALVPNINFASLVHPSAQIGKNVKIGRGVAIMAGAIINSDTSIEDFTIINTKASIDHDNKIFNFSSLAPNATTGGNVSVGEFSAISIGATIKHGISIGKHTIIGAGALVLNNFGDNCIVYGTPAKEIRKRTAGERYL